MIKIRKSRKGTSFVHASELYNSLEINSLPLKQWIDNCINLGFKRNTDYFFLTDSDTGNYVDCAFRLEMAKHIALIQKTKRGRALREYLIRLDRKYTEGELLNRKQIIALLEITQVLGYFSLQKYLETEHFELIGKSYNWWNYRAELLGYSANDLKEGIRALKIKYKNQRQALFHLDKFELIKQATIDLFVILGKDQKYAKNIGILAKEIAIEINPPIYDDNGPLDFKSDKEKRTIEFLKLNSNSIGNPLNQF